MTSTDSNSISTTSPAHMTRAKQAAAQIYICSLVFLKHFSLLILFSMHYTLPLTLHHIKANKKVC